MSNDLTKIEPRLFYNKFHLLTKHVKGWIFFLSFFGIIGAYIQFELPAQVVAILWLATKQSSQVASNGKIDEELVHKVEQLQNFLFWEAPKMDFLLSSSIPFLCKSKICFLQGSWGPGFDSPLYAFFIFLQCFTSLSVEAASRREWSNSDFLPLL